MVVPLATRRADRTISTGPWAATTRRPVRARPRPARARPGPGCPSRAASRRGTPSSPRTCAAMARPTPRATGYDLESLALDMLTVVAAQGWGAAVGGPAVVVAGHGLGAMRRGRGGAPGARVGGGPRARRRRLGGGRRDDADARPSSSRRWPTRPRSWPRWTPYLADRRDFDPATWDADQERGGTGAVVEKHAGHVSAVVTGARSSRRLVEAIYAYQPLEALGRLRQPGHRPRRRRPGRPTTRSAASDSSRSRTSSDARRAAGLDAADACACSTAPGHDLMRYRPDAVAAAIAELAVREPWAEARASGTM